MSFVVHNWDNVLLTIASVLLGGLISVLIGYVFYKLAQRGAATALLERRKRARDELFDAIESFIVNKQTISEASISNLLAASERAHDVSLASVCTP